MSAWVSTFWLFLGSLGVGVLISNVFATLRLAKRLGENTAALLKHDLERTIERRLHEHAQGYDRGRFNRGDRS